MFNMVLWIYLGVRMCFVIVICQGSEYAWVCSWTMLEYVWIYLKQNLKQLYKLSSIYRYIFIDTYLESCQTSKAVEEQASCKNNYSLELFSKDLHYVWQGSKYPRTFEYSRVMPRTMNTSWFLTCHGS